MCDEPSAPPVIPPDPRAALSFSKGAQGLLPPPSKILWTLFHQAPISPCQRNIHTETDGMGSLIPREEVAVREMHTCLPWGWAPCSKFQVSLPSLEGPEPQPGGGPHVLHLPAELLHVSAVLFRQREGCDSSKQERSCHLGLHVLPRQMAAYSRRVLFRAMVRTAPALV